MTHADVVIVDSIPVNDGDIATQNDISRFPHMSDVHLHEDENCKEVEMLLGADLGGTFMTENGLRREKANEPVAMKSLWGYCILGPICMEEGSANM